MAEEAYIGISMGVLLVLLGFWVRRYPDMLSTFSMMSEEDKKNVDLESAGKTACIWLAVMGIASVVMSCGLSLAGFPGEGLAAMVVVVCAGAVILTVKLRKYDRSRSARKWNMLLAGFLGVFTVMVAVLLVRASRPNGVDISDGKLSFSGQYGMAVKISDIRSVTLEDSLPEIEARTNGVGMGNVQKGHFRLSGLGKCRLFVNLKYTPYLHIVTWSGENIFFNSRDPELTRSIYGRLVELMSWPEKNP